MIFSQDPILNIETMRCVLHHYLGDISKQAAVDPLISPYFADDDIINQFPPTVTCVGDVDPLIDDATAFFNRGRLKRHSILKIYGTLPHGYLNLPTQLPKARKAIKDAGEYMKFLVECYTQSSHPLPSDLLPPPKSK